jgi:hypothetical protein
VFVDPELDIREQIGCILDLIQKDGGAHGFEEKEGVAFGLFSNAKMVQSDITVFGKEFAKQCGFSGLSWAGKDDNGCGTRRLDDEAFNGTVEVTGHGGVLRDM